MITSEAGTTMCETHSSSNVSQEDEIPAQEMQTVTHSSPTIGARGQASRLPTLALHPKAPSRSCRSRVPAQAHCNSILTMLAACVLQIAPPGLSADFSLRGKATSFGTNNRQVPRVLPTLLAGEAAFEVQGDADKEEKTGACVQHQG